MVDVLGSQMKFPVAKWNVFAWGSYFCNHMNGMMLEVVHMFGYVNKTNNVYVSVCLCVR